MFLLLYLIFALDGSFELLVVVAVSSLTYIVLPT